MQTAFEEFKYEQEIVVRTRRLWGIFFQVKILPNEDCNALYGIMTENMMCTSGANAQGSCFGDSGGPAIVRQPDGAWVQVKMESSLVTDFVIHFLGWHHRLRSPGRV